MDSHTPLWYVEAACQKYLQAEAVRPDWLPELQVYRGAENRDNYDMEGQESSLKVLPCVVLVCQDAAAMLHPFLGLWKPMLIVSVELSRTAETGDAADQKAQEVFDRFMTPSIRQDVSAKIQGLAIQGWTQGDIRRRAEGRRWVFEMDFNLEHVKRKPLWQT